MCDSAILCGLPRGAVMRFFPSDAVMTAARTHVSRPLGDVLEALTVSSPAGVASLINALNEGCSKAFERSTLLYNLERGPFVMALRAAALSSAAAGPSDGDEDGAGGEGGGAEGGGGAGGEDGGAASDGAASEEGSSEDEEEAGPEGQEDAGEEAADSFLFGEPDAEPVLWA